MPCTYIEAYSKLVIYLAFTPYAKKLIQSTSKCLEKRKRSIFKTKTKVKKIKITRSKFFNNLINSNCKRS